MSRLPVSLVALFVAATAFATPPAAPQVTVGASNVKQLRFDWQIVPRSNYYELWFKANNGAPEVKFSESVPWHPFATTGVSAHLLEWNQARYRVRACNPSGCGSSPLISVKSVLPDTVGFVKSPFPLDEARFGSIVKVSEDGSTLVVVADETNGKVELTPNSVVSNSVVPLVDFPENLVRAYVFKRQNSVWRFDSVLNLESLHAVGLSLALSKDGSRMAIETPPSERTGESGVVRVFRRASTGWVMEEDFPQGDRNLGVFDFVDMDGAGDTLIIIEGDNDIAMRVYTRTGTVWTLVANPPLGKSCYQCAKAAVSSDGSTIAAVSSGGIDVFVAPTWTLRNHIAGPSSTGRLSLDSTGNTVAIQATAQGAQGQVVPSVAVYHRTTGEYALEANLLPSSWAYNPPRMTTTQFGAALALSSDDRFLAVGDSADNTIGEGVLSPPLQGPTQDIHGAVYIFQRHDTSWSLRRLVKPNHAPPGIFGADPREGFGSALSLGDSGKTLIVGQPNESTFVLNPDSLQPNPTGVNSGAVWIY